MLSLNGSTATTSATFSETRFSRNSFCWWYRYVKCKKLQETTDRNEPVGQTYCCMVQNQNKCHRMYRMCHRVMYLLPGWWHIQEFSTKENFLLVITWWGVHQYPQNDFRYVHYSTDVFTLVFSCAVSLEWSDLSSHNVAYMLVWLLVYSYKKFSISKISLDFKNSKPKCVSGHSEQLWFLNPPQGSTWAQTDPKIPLPHFGHKHPVHFISF